MSRYLPPALLLFVSLTPMASAVMCPVAMVSGTGARDGISITFRNQTKLPIRRLEFRCTVAPSSHKTPPGTCVESNALFYPGGQYTVNYPYPGGVPRPVKVTVQSVLLMDGFVWKPSKHDVCSTLRITPPKPPVRRNTR